MSLVLNLYPNLRSHWGEVWTHDNLQMMQVFNPFSDNTNFYYYYNLFYPTKDA